VKSAVVIGRAGMRERRSPMREVEEKAMFCVGRAVMFSGLAIALVMLSFAFDPSAAFKAGGVLGLVVAAILIWYAQTAHRRNPRNTETWLLLEERLRPVGEPATRAFATVMADTYAWYAVRTFMAATTSLCVGILLSLLGVGAILY